MSFKKVAYWVSIVFPLIDFCKTFAENVRKFEDTRRYIEELAEFKTEDEVSTIVNSVLRAELPPGLNYKVIYSYNPPKRKQSWVNKKFETQFVPNNTYVHHSTYLDNPHISKAFIQEANETKPNKANKLTNNFFIFFHLFLSFI